MGRFPSWDPAVAAEIVFDPERLVETHAHAVDGAWLIENPGFVSGGSTLWLAENVLGVRQGELFDVAAAAPAGSGATGGASSAAAKYTPPSAMGRIAAPPCQATVRSPSVPVAGW